MLFVISTVTVVCSPLIILRESTGIVSFEPIWLIISASVTSKRSLALLIASWIDILISADWLTVLIGASPPNFAASKAFGLSVITASPDIVRVSTALPE